MAFTQVAVAGTYVLADGTPAEGAVRFTPTDPMRNDGIVIAAPVTADLDGDGALSTTLAATDDVGTLPTGVGYRVEPLLAGQPTHSYLIVVPQATVGALDLAAVVPATLTAATVDTLTQTQADALYQPLDTVHAVGNSGTALTLNPTVIGPIKTVTLTGNCAFTLAGATAGAAVSLELILTQDATGSRIVTWPASVKWSGLAPTLSTGAGEVDRVVLVTYNGGTAWYGDLVGKGYA